MPAEAHLAQRDGEEAHGHRGDGVWSRQGGDPGWMEGLLAGGPGAPGDPVALQPLAKVA
jgi:hypothetical protein